MAGSSFRQNAETSTPLACAPWILSILALAFLVCSATSRAQQAGTFSPVVSYQYQDSLVASDVMSPVVSYQYYEWPGDENLPLVRSQNVSYLYGTIGPDGLSISGPATIGTGTNITYPCCFQSMACRWT